MKCENSFTMLTKEHLVHVFQISYIFMFVSFHIAIGLMCVCVCVCMCVCVCVCVNERDVENEKREIIVENKLWCINVMLLCC